MLRAEVFATLSVNEFFLRKNQTSQLAVACVVFVSSESNRGWQCGAVRLAPLANNKAPYAMV